MSGQRTEGDHHFETTGFILNGNNLEGQNGISTPFRKRTPVELLFHFFPFLFYFFPYLSKG
jgi:hypothetical protein